MQQQAEGDLVLIAFYYLHQVGEYTITTRKKKKRKITHQFRVKDVSFFLRDKRCNPIAMPRDAVGNNILQAVVVTLHISNQKNGHARAYQGMCPSRGKR